MTKKNQDNVFALNNFHINEHLPENITGLLAETFKQEFDKTIFATCKMIAEEYFGFIGGQIIDEQTINNIKTALTIRCNGNVYGNISYSVMYDDSIFLNDVFATLYYIVNNSRVFFTLSYLESREEANNSQYNMQYWYLVSKYYNIDHNADKSYKCIALLEEFRDLKTSIPLNQYLLSDVRRCEALWSANNICNILGIKDFVYKCSWLPNINCRPSTISKEAATLLEKLSISLEELNEK